MNKLIGFKAVKIQPVQRKKEAIRIFTEIHFVPTWAVYINVVMLVFVADKIISDIFLSKLWGAER